MTLISMPKRLTEITYEAYFEFSKEVKIAENLTAQILFYSFYAPSRKNAVEIARNYFYELYEKYKISVEIKSLTEYNSSTNKKTDIKIDVRLPKKRN